MKRYLFPLLLLIIVACNKKTNTPPANPTPGNPQNPAPTNPPAQANVYWWKFIPNWYNGDTLIGEIFKPSTQGGLPEIVGYDTIYTWSNKDTSYITHNGVKYYIWTAKYLMNHPNDTFKNNQSSYVNVYINTKIDTLNAFSYGLFSQADPYTYLDKNGTWKRVKQRLTIDNSPNSPFKATNALLDNVGFYIGINTK